MRFLSNGKSRAAARLLLLGSPALVTLANGTEAPRLYLEQRIALDATGAGKGIALTASGGGDLFILLGPAPRIVIWSPTEGVRGEFSLAADQRLAALDVAGDGGLGIIVVDPFRQAIFCLSRRGEPAVKIIPATDHNLEPRTLCADSYGLVYLLNGRDGDIWRLERDGRALPLQIAGRESARNDIARLEFSPAQGRLLLLSGGVVRVMKLDGSTVMTLPAVVPNPVGIAADSSGVWVVGEGLAFLPLSDGLERRKPAPPPPPYCVGGETTLPAEVFGNWGLLPVADIAAAGERLFILAADGGSVGVLRIERPARGHP